MLTPPQLSQILDAIIKAAKSAEKGNGTDATTPAGFRVKMWFDADLWRVDVWSERGFLRACSTDPRPWKAATAAAYTLGRRDQARQSQDAYEAQTQAARFPRA